MPKRLKYRGKEFSFPDEASEEMIVSFLQEQDFPVAEAAEKRKAALPPVDTGMQAPEAPGLGRYLKEELKSGFKSFPGAAVGLAQSVINAPGAMIESVGRSIGGETFSQDNSWAFPTESDQDIALRQQITRGTGKKKGIASPLFAGERFGDVPQTGAPLDRHAFDVGIPFTDIQTRIDPLNLTEEGDFWREYQRPPKDIEEYQNWISQQDLGTRINPFKGGWNWHAIKNILGTGAQSIPQMGAIAAASLAGGPAAGAVAGTAFGVGNAGADNLKYESERGYASPTQEFTASVGGGLGGASEAIPIGKIISGAGAPGVVRRSLTNALEEGGQEMGQGWLEAMTAADPSRREEFNLSDPAALAGRQLETALKAAGPSLGHSAVIEGGTAAFGKKAPATVPTGPRTEKGVSAATSPNKAARIVPTTEAAPPGMAQVDLPDGRRLLYDPAKEPSRLGLLRRLREPGAVEAYVGEAPTDTAVSTTDTAQEAPAAPVPMTEAEYRKAAEEIRLKAIAKEEADALVPLEPMAAEDETRDYLAQLEQQAAPVQPDAATLPVPVNSARPVAPGQPPTSRLDLLYDLRDRGTQLSPEEVQRLDFAIAAEEAKLAPEPLPNQFPDGVPGVEIPGAEGPFAAAQDLLARRDALGPVAELPVSGTLQEKPIPRSVAEESPLETTPPVAPRDLREAALGAFKENPPLEELIRPTGPEPKSSIDVLREMLAVADVPRAARVLAGIPEPKKEGLAERKTRERAEAKKPKPDPKPAPVASPTMPAPVVPAPVVQEAAPPAPKAPKTKLGNESNEEYKARILAAKEAKAAAEAAKKKPVSDRVIATIPPPKTAEDVAREKAEREAAATAQPMMDRVAETRAKKTPVAGPDPLVARYQAAVDAEKRLRMERNAQEDPDFKLDEYNEAVAELYESKKAATAKGLDVSATEPSFQLEDPKRLVRQQRYGEVRKAISRPEMDKALDEMKKRLPGIADLIDVIESQTELDPRVQEAAKGTLVDALTHKGRITLVAENMKSAQHVRDAVIHEAVGHLVPQQIFGKDGWRKKLDGWRKDSTYFRDFVKAFGETPEGRTYRPDELAEEAVSFHAAKLRSDPNYKPPTAFRMLIAKVREWLRETFGGRVAEFSDADLAAFLARSEEKARVGFEPNADGDVSFSKRPEGRIDPQDVADDLTTITEESDGMRTIVGRPERANPGLNPEARQVSVAYEHNREAPDPQKIADWQAEGERIALEPDALQKLTDKRENLTPEEVYAAKLLISDEGLASFKDPGRLDKLIRLMDKYTASGRQAARELRARTDDVLSPVDRHRQYILEALLEDFPESSWKKLLLGEVEKGDTRTKLQILRDGLSGLPGRAISDQPFQNETPQERADRAKKLMDDLKKDTGLDLRSPDFDFADRGNVLTVMKYLGANRASIPDKIFEMWQNNILSGPLTHKFNTISNLTNGLVQFGILKPLEGLYGAGTPGMRDALAAWKGMLPGISRGLANAAYGWENEVRRSTMMGTDQKFREGVGRVGKIGGKLGKTWRSSYRALLAEDEFFRGVWGEMQAASTAYGIARREGLKGEALTRRMQELQADPSSPAWVDNDEIVDEYLFQEKLGDVGRAVVNIRNNIPGLRYIVPFVSTNVNVAKRGFSFLPGAGILSELVGHREGPKDASLGARIAARQTVGVLMTMAVMGMLDDEDDPSISGSPVSSRLGENKQAERDFQMRTGGAQSVKIGDNWYGFGRLEPFATAVATIADFITATKKARRSGEWGKEAQEAGSKLLNQFSEKTFLANIGTLWKAVGNPAEEIPNLAGNIAGGFVPASGALRQFARLADPNVREVGVWGATKPDDKGERKAERQARRILFRIMPIAALAGAEPKVSAYGEEYKKGAGPLEQLLSPLERQPDQSPEAKLLDLAIRRMNRRNPGQEYYPPIASRSASMGEDEAGDYGEDPVSRKYNQYFSDRELHDLAQTRGKAAVQHLLELIKEHQGKLPTEGRPNTPGFREAFKLGTQEGLERIGMRE